MWKGSLALVLLNACLLAARLETVERISWTEVLFSHLIETRLYSGNPLTDELAGITRGVILADNVKEHT